MPGPACCGQKAWFSRSSAITCGGGAHPCAGARQGGGVARLPAIVAAGRDVRGPARPLNNGRPTGLISKSWPPRLPGQSSWASLPMVWTSWANQLSIAETSPTFCVMARRARPRCTPDWSPPKRVLPRPPSMIGSGPFTLTRRPVQTQLPVGGSCETYPRRSNQRRREGRCRF